MAKENIHPQYYKNAKVRCACRNTFTTGSTRKEIEVEICYKCHPFYTGEDKLIDTAGRVERFKARRSRAKTNLKSKKAKRKIKKEVKSKNKK